MAALHTEGRKEPSFFELPGKSPDCYGIRDTEYAVVIDCTFSCAPSFDAV